MLTERAGPCKKRFRQMKLYYRHRLRSLVLLLSKLAIAGPPSVLKLSLIPYPAVRCAPIAVDGIFGWVVGSRDELMLLQ